MLRLPPFLLTFLLMALGCTKEASDITQTESTTSPTSSNTTQDTSAPQTPVAYSGDVAKLLGEMKNSNEFYTKKLKQAKPKDWTTNQRLARNYMVEGRLTGRWEPYVEAQTVIEDAFTFATQPLFERMNHNFTLHRLDAVEKDIATFEKSILKSGDKVNRVTFLRASMAMQRGQLDEAQKQFEALQKSDKSYTPLVGLAELALKTGDIDGARKLLDEAIEKSTRADKYTQAFVLLQRGIVELEVNDLDKALMYFTRGNNRFSGWYLIEEHIAEVLASQGKLESAETRYRDIIARTDRAEFMDALAGVLEEQGKRDEAKTWLDKAEKTYARDMAIFPEAVWGHGLDHFLTKDDPTQALEIAKKNHTARPGFDAKVSLAQALIRNNKLDEAKVLIDETLASKWSTASLHATASKLFALMGDDAKSKTQAERANALSPGSVDDLDWLKPVSK